MGKLLSTNGVGNVERLEVDDEHYDIRVEISGWEQSRIDSVGVVSILETEVGKRRKRGDKVIQESQGRAYKRELASIMSRMTAWSHSVKITEANVKRLPEKDYFAIIDQISEYEDRGKDLSEDSPLDESSDVLSKKTSPEVASESRTSTTKT